MATGILPEWAKNPADANITSLADDAFQGPSTYEPTDQSLVSGQLSRLLSKDSPYLQAARTRATQMANGRGLLNSSMAASAGELSAIQSALPIAQQDATTFDSSQRFNADAANTFARDSNAFLREGALTKFRGVLDTAARNDEAGLRRELAQMDVDARYGLQDRDAALQRELTGADRDLRSSLADREIAARYGLLSQEQAGNRELSELDQAGRMALLEREQALQRELSALDEQFRRDELGFRSGSTDRELGLRESELGLRGSELGLKEQDLALQRDELAAKTAAADADRRSQVAAEVADIRQQAIDARTRLESDPNMTDAAKREAIVALGQQASADIRELVQLSGIDMPDAWPEWINELTPTSAPAPAPQPNIITNPNGSPGLDLYNPYLVGEGA